MKKNFAMQAHNEWTAIKAKLSDVGVDLQEHLVGYYTPHWIFTAGREQIAQYWPTTGRAVISRTKKSHEAVSPSAACDLVIREANHPKRITASKTKAERRMSQNLNRRDGSVSRPVSERLPEALSEPIQFGKHRGKTWMQIPDDYLQWAAENLKSAWLRELAATALAEKLLNASCALKNTVDKPVETPQQCAVTVRFPDKPMGEWDRKYLYWAVEAYGPETEIHQRAKELLVEEAPF